MQLRPKVGGADKGEEDEEMLKRRPAEGPPKGFQTSGRLRSLEENVGGTDEDGLLNRGVGVGEAGRGRSTSLQKCDVRFEVVALRQLAAD